MLNLLDVARTGRPKKPAGQKFVGRHIKAPSELWDELDAYVPERRRAAFIRDAVRTALRRLRRQGAESPPEPDPADDQSST